MGDLFGERERKDKQSIKRMQAHWNNTCGVVIKTQKTPVRPQSWVLVSGPRMSFLYRVN